MTEKRTTESYDVIVAGSGGGAMTAALRAHDLGLSVLVVEKSDRYGGTTAISGGGIWIPCNDQIEGLGGSDSYEEALTYLRTVVAEDFDEERIRSYLDNGPKMVRYLAEKAGTQFLAVARYPDYYPHLPGGKPGYRTMEPAPFDASRLGDEYERLRKPSSATLVADRMMLTQVEAHKVFVKEPGWIWLMLKRSLAYLTDFSWRRRSKLDRRLTLGAALIASLRHAMLERGIPLWLNTSLQSLVTTDGRVSGVVVERNGESVTLTARRGVVLATGGFESNQAMREQYLPQPTKAEWTAAPHINSGEGIRAGEAVGAELGLMAHVWGAPTVHMPGQSMQRPLFIERSSPGCLIVNRAGKRFINEAAPYPDIVDAMYAEQQRDGGGVPAWFVFDADFRRKYPCGVLMPGSVQPDKKLPADWLDKVFYRADTLEELAGKIGVDPAGLVATAKRMNEFATSGVDADFGKGDNAFDRYYGDPKVKPNPCLGPVAKGPFYALRLDPGDIGTKGGLRTDGQARVLRPDGSAIEGLYAIGNTSAAVMGKTYPGPGSTIGPAMTFGFVAANHLAAAVPAAATVTDDTVES